MRMWEFPFLSFRDHLNGTHGMGGSNWMQIYGTFGGEKDQISTNCAGIVWVGVI